MICCLDLSCIFCFDVLDCLDFCLDVFDLLPKSESPKVQPAGLGPLARQKHKHYHKQHTQHNNRTNHTQHETETASEQTTRNNNFLDPRPVGPHVKCSEIRCGGAGRPTQKESKYLIGLCRYEKRCVFTDRRCVCVYATINLLCYDDK